MAPGKGFMQLMGSVSVSQSPEPVRALAMGRLLRLGYSLSMEALSTSGTLLLVRSWNSMKPEAYLLRFRGVADLSMKVPSPSPATCTSAVSSVPALLMSTALMLVMATGEAVTGCKLQLSFSDWMLGVVPPLAPTPNRIRVLSPGGVVPPLSPPLLPPVLPLFESILSAPPHPPSRAAAINDAKSPFFDAFILTTPINGKNIHRDEPSRLKQTLCNRCQDKSCWLHFLEIDFQCNAYPL